MTRADGVPEPFTEAGHSTKYDTDRSRVICMECPWFKWMPGATAHQIKQAGWHHRDATRLR